MDSLVHKAIVRRTEANIAVIDSLKEKMHPFIKEIENVIEKENFYPPRIKGKNNELVGEGISLHIPIVSKPESVKERLSPSVKSIDKARNNLIELDIPIQELKPAIELLYEPVRATDKNGCTFTNADPQLITTPSEALTFTVELSDYNGPQ